jgi:hypothetical protein
MNCLVLSSKDVATMSNADIQAAIERKSVTIEDAQRWVESVQDERPCRQCEFADYTVTRVDTGALAYHGSLGLTTVYATCGCCGWQLQGVVSNKKILAA